LGAAVIVFAVVAVLANATVVAVLAVASVAIGVVDIAVGIHVSFYCTSVRSSGDLGL
jgi:hypothetical protein